LATLLAALRAAGLEAKRMRLVHADTDAPARVALIEARQAKPGGLLVEPPLVERAAHGYSEELRALLEQT
jgi:tRNA1(Val) A37 N6-methylase TrmN6